MRILFVLPFVCLLLQGCATDSVVEEIEAEFVIPEDMQQVADAARKSAQDGDLLSARQKYLGLLQDEPENLSYRLEYAAVLFRLGSIEGAQQQHLKVLEVAKCDYPVDKAGDAKEDLKPLDGEAPQESQVQAVDVRYCSMSLNALGAISDMNADPVAAEKYYQGSLAAFDRDVSVYNNYGYSLMMQQRYREAEKVLRKGMKVDPYAERLRHNLALTKAWLGDYDEALKAYSVKARDPEAYNNVGYIALLNEDYQVAINLFEKAIELSPVYYVKAAQNLERAQELVKDASKEPKKAAIES